MTSSLVYLLLFVTGWSLTHYIHYCHWHKLASFPGPRLAAVSVLWRAYYQVWKNGELVEQMKHVHQVYGMSLQIRNEASITP